MTDPILDVIAYLDREIERHMTPPPWFDHLNPAQQQKWFLGRRRESDMLAFRRLLADRTRQILSVASRRTDQELSERVSE